MKNLSYKITVVFLGILLSSISLSCDDYLEKPPGVDVTEDTIFSSPVQVDYFVAGTYFMGVKSDFPYWNDHDRSDIGWGAATDEADDVNNLASGYYIIQVQTDTDTKTFRVIKK